MSSRKDYEKLAEVLVQVRPRMSERAYRSVVTAIGDMYASQNPKFDRAIWRKACGFTNH